MSQPPIGIVALLALVPGLAWAGETAGAPPAAATSCTVYDRTPACCPHPPPSCCTPTARALVSPQAVARTCRAARSPRGEAGSLESCDLFYGSDIVGRVSSGLQAGSARTLAQLRKQLAGEGQRVTSLSIAGADEALLSTALSDGSPVRAVGWARLGARLVHVESDAEVCSSEETATLLRVAVEQQQGRPSASRTAARTPSRPSTKKRPARSKPTRVGGAP